MRDGVLTIGRGPENDLVLPDPDRVISKRHCVLEQRGAEYYLIDTSTNGTFLNYEVERMPSAPVMLSEGDVIGLGGYELKVSLDEIAPPAPDPAPRGAQEPLAPLPSDPFAAPPPNPAMAQNMAHGMAPNVAPGGPVVGGDGDDVLNAVLGKATEREERPAGERAPFAEPLAPENPAPLIPEDDDLFGPISGDRGAAATASDHAPAMNQHFSPPSVVQPAPAGEAPGGAPAPGVAPGRSAAAFADAGSMIPEDWDKSIVAMQHPQSWLNRPSEPDYKPSASANDEPAVSVLSKLPAQPIPSDIGPLPASASAAADPFPMTGEMARPVTPLAGGDAGRAPDGAPAPGGALETDALDTGAGRTKPRRMDGSGAVPSTSPAPAAQTTPPPSPSAQAAARAAAEQRQPDAQPGGARGRSRPPSAERDLPRAAGSRNPARQPEREPAPERAPGQAPTEAERAALTAFLRGAGMGHVSLPDDAVEDTMTRMGAVLRIMIQGLREVLMTRAEVKREFRIEQTLISAAGNNPLKFSISPEQAVEAMIRGNMPGYLGAEAAATEALDDIKAHEVATLTGMEAALKGLLERLDPSVLTQRVEVVDGLGGFLSGNRKAKYWELYEKMYAELAREAEDDFHRVFGKEFARAYEEQQKKL
ncbi:MAG: type VI secretion system-associated FHA domain protein TagH [Pseudomonadota bacterium]